MTNKIIKFHLDSYEVKQYEGEHVVDDVTLEEEVYPTRKKWILVYSPKLLANILAPKKDLTEIKE